MLFTLARQFVGPLHIVPHKIEKGTEAGKLSSLAKLLLSAIRN